MFHGVGEPHADRARAPTLCYTGCVDVSSFGKDRSDFDDNLSSFVAVEACK